MPEAVYDHRYVFDEIGYNLKPLDLQAAMGLQQLKKLESLDQARRENFKKLSDIFEPYKQYFHLPVATNKADPCWFGYLMTVRPDAPFDKEDIVRYMEDSKIQTRSYFAGNILAHPGYRHLSFKYTNLSKSFPIARLVTTHSFFLGTFAGLTDDKMAYIKETVDQFFEDL